MLNSRLAWSTERFPGQPEESLSHSTNEPTNKQIKNKNKNKNPVRPKRGFCITLPIHAGERTERAIGG